MIHLLILEDDPQLCDILRFYLKEKSDYRLFFAESAEAALELLETTRFDIMLLDVMLPGMDGIAFCKKVRENSDCPIIFTSCLNDGKTIIRALETGGDDYITKPFEPSVLIAHIEAKLRRKSSGREEEKLQAGGLCLNRKLRTVCRGEERIPLSQTEYNLLAYFMEHKGEFVSFDDAYSAIWNAPSLGNYRALFVHISNLRKKIEKDPNNPQLLKTHLRTGYIFAE